VGGKFPRTLNLNTVVKDSDVDVVSNAVVTVNNRIGNDLMKGYLRVGNSF